MLISFYKSSRAGVVFTIPLLAIVLWINAFIHPYPLVESALMPFYELTLRILPSYQWVHTLTALLLMLTSALLVNHLVDHFEVLSQRTNLPAFFYVIIMSCCGAIQTLHPALFANVLMLLALMRVISSYRKEMAFSEAFDTGFLLSLAALFYLPSLAFVPMLFIAMAIMRPFVWRESLILFIGILLPFLFVFTWYFWFDQTKVLVNEKIVRPLMERDFSFHISSAYIFLCIVLGAIAALSIGKLLLAEAPIKLRSKKIIQLLFGFLLFSLFSLLLVYSVHAVHFSFFAIPLSIMFSHYFLRIKKSVVSEGLLLLLMIAIAIGFIL